MSRGPRSAQAERDWGRDEVGCSILHVDMDAFFASVELARRPQLRGLPVIVGGATRGVVLAATYEARAFGVHSAMPMAVALRQCPQAVVVPPDHHAYHEVSAGVMRGARRRHGARRAGERRRGVPRRRGRPPTARAADRRSPQLIRRQVREQFGITCSVGIGSTKFVAKLASGHAKPDGVLLVPRAATVDFLRVAARRCARGAWVKRPRRRWRAGGSGRSRSSRTATCRRCSTRSARSRARTCIDLAWGRDPRPVQPGPRGEVDRRGGDVRRGRRGPRRGAGEGARAGGPVRGPAAQRTAWSPARSP